MKIACLGLALIFAAPPARAWRLFGEPSDKKIVPIQILSDHNRSVEVLSALTPDFMQTLRGTDLRQAYILKGDNLDRLGRGDEALGVYQLGVRLFPKNVDLLTRQGGLLHRTGLDEQAQPLFLKALEFEPRHFGAHLGLAEIYRHLGFFDRSASHYEAALETLDERASVWRDYAETLLAQRDWTTADLALQRALTLEPKNPDGHILLGFSRRAQGDLPGALSALDGALALGAGIGAKRAKALWLIEIGRPAAAMTVADDILRESPGDAAAIWARARAQAAKGLTAKAAAELAPLTAGPRADFPARAARVMRDALTADTARR